MKRDAISESIVSINYFTASTAPVASSKSTSVLWILVPSKGTDMIPQELIEDKIDCHDLLGTNETLLNLFTLTVRSIQITCTTIQRVCRCRTFDLWPFIFNLP